VQIRNAKSGREVGRLIHPTLVQTMAFRPDGQSIVTLSSRYYGNDFPIRVWYLDGTGSVTEIRQSEQIDKIRFSKDSRLIFIHTPTGLQSWHLPQSDAEINLALRRSDEKISDPSSIGILNRYDVIRDKDQLEVVDRIDERRVGGVGLSGKTFATKVSADGKWLAVVLQPPGATRGGWKLKGEIYDLQDKSPAREIPFPDFTSDEYVDFLEFSFDSRYLIIATNSLFRISDIATLKTVAEIYLSFPRVIAIQPDGELVATASRNNVLRVWRISDGSEVIRIENDLPVKALAVSPDGRWLASLHAAGFVRLWAIGPADLIAQACARLSSPCP
jgi:WD40 repeat protein